MKRTILFFFIITQTAWVWAQCAPSYDSVEVFFHPASTTTFVEGQQPDFIWMLRNMSDKNYNALLTTAFILYDRNSNEQIKDQHAGQDYYEPWTGYRPCNRLEVKDGYLKANYRKILDATSIQYSYGKYQLEKLQTDIPTGFTLPIGQYRLRVYVDICPLQKCLETWYDFDVKAATAEQERELKDYVACIRASQAMKTYDPNAALSMHSYLKKYPNGTYTEQLCN